MKRYFSLLLLVLFLSSCSNSAEEKIQHLNGYWEIKKAESPRGTKEFPFSEIVDYIEVSGKEGIRKKVRPQIGGTFITSEDHEKFTVKVENDSLNLYYETPYSKWKETVLVSENDALKLLNPDGIIYTYKRFTPFSENYGEEN